MDYIEGEKITNLSKLQQYGINGKDLSLRGINLYFEQVFEHGFFHADPHPGNILVLDDGTIAFIDFGMMGTVIDSDKGLFAQLLLTLYNKDADGLKRSILQFTDKLSKEKIKELEYDIHYFLRQYSRIALEDINGEEVMKGLNALFFDYKVKIPANLLLLIKALIIIEGVGLKLDPSYDIVQNIGPYVKKLISQKYDPRKMGKEMLRSIEESGELMKDLPFYIKEILENAKDGKFHVEIQHAGMDPFNKDFISSINRLALALVFVAMLVSSTILIATKIPPMTNNISLLGLVGLILSLLVGLRLLYTLKKKRT
jgi:ubiquinone biosynthesis protein